MSETEIVNTTATEAPKSFDAAHAATTAEPTELKPWIIEVGDVVILRGQALSDRFMLMTVENTFEQPDPKASVDEIDALITLVEVAWLRDDGTLQRATFDKRAIVTLDEHITALGELDDDAPAASSEAKPAKRRGRPPGTKNKRKRKAKR